MVLGMKTKIFVWFVWIVMGWCEFVDFYMKFLLELGQGLKNLFFFGQKSIFGWVGNDFRKEKSEVKKSEKKRK